MKDQKIKASQHPSYATFTIIAVLFPIIGIILGVAYLTKNLTIDKKLGEHTLTLSILFMFIITPILWYVFVRSESPHSVYVPVSNYSSTTQLANPSSTWDYQTAYERVNTGMTKSQVEAAVGKSSTDCTEAEVQGYVSESCTYGGYGDGGILVVQFGNSLVISKSKSTIPY